MIAVFAGTALFLATIGIYGVIAYSVAQRRKEIGIRMALGADEPLIRRLVFNQTFRILGVGLLLGVPASLMFGRLCQALLFQVKPGDPMAMASTVAVLTLVALCATYIPALRATRVDPLAALHEE
jgi:putative ABC transport system permease protein